MGTGETNTLKLTPGAKTVRPRMFVAVVINNYGLGHLRSRPTELDGTFRPRFVKPVAPTELPTQITSTSARDIFERFDFATQIEKLAKCNLLYQVTEKFAGIDLHPDVVSNNQMGLAFEDLIRKFAELSNETAGEHFTTREVIRLMVNLLFIEDGDVLSKPGVGRPR